jgi:hypothetical protein
MDELFRTMLKAVNDNPNIRLSALAKIAKVDISEHYVGCDLRGEDLSNDNLDNFNFSEADLSNTNLRGTTLRDDKLIKTNLSEADLRGADLIGADLTEADLTEALYNKDTKFDYSVCYSKTLQDTLRELIKKVSSKTAEQQILEKLLSPDTNWAERFDIKSFTKKSNLQDENVDSPFEKIESSLKDLIKKIEESDIEFFITKNQLINILGSLRENLNKYRESLIIEKLSLQEKPSASPKLREIMPTIHSEKQLKESETQFEQNLKKDIVVHF